MTNTSGHQCAALGMCTSLFTWWSVYVISGEGGLFSFVARLISLTVNNASPSKRGTVPTPNRGTAKVQVRFFRTLDKTFLRISRPCPASLCVATINFLT